MVKLTQIDDADVAQFEKVEVTAPVVADESDSEQDDSDFDDDFDLENETIYERIVALKDIIAPEQRSQIVNAGENVKAWASSAFQKTGNFLWIVTSSALLLGVPLTLSILAETQLQEMEKEMSLQQSAQDVLAPGTEGAFAEKK
ncbi:hypothetical protein DIURU_001173 [Diutina rugosa]|uniref:Mitochondrial import receptor subunit TOM22 n=1 Tax=Diutina rugosa TaxID=5481 RepID=A0A642UVN1_DIURU|nr:uncharacterized protein DIURU_001173 [Diutina rugosa]KAA8906231.1 hypothetical protein DIURU_001173 [Diutina rugosa]